MTNAPVAVVDVPALYALHRLALIRMAVLLVDDIASAEDVVQDAFLGLYRNQHKVREPAAALGYLRTAVVNASRSVLRRRQTMRKHLLALAPKDAEPVDSEVMLDADHREVLGALHALPPGQREVLILRYWSNLSEAEIADALGLSRGAVKSQASRGIDKLEKILEGTR